MSPLAAHESSNPPGTVPFWKSKQLTTSDMVGRLSFFTLNDVKSKSLVDSLAAVDVSVLTMDSIVSMVFSMLSSLFRTVLHSHFSVM